MINPALSSEELLAKVRPVVARELDVPVEKVTPQARFVEDLGADSLDTVELILCLEEELGIEISNEEAEKFRTVSDLLNYLQQKDSAKG